VWCARPTEHKYRKALDKGFVESSFFSVDTTAAFGMAWLPTQLREWGCDCQLSLAPSVVALTLSVALRRTSVFANSGVTK